MDLYLAGTEHAAKMSWYIETVKKYRPLILSSFFYCDESVERLIPFCEKFLLDSGAFSFITAKNNVSRDWNSYVDKYADFVIRNNVQYFCELDIDKIVGLRGVEKLRHRLENRVGRRCIPVWHRTRGKDDFLAVCRDYDYVALGGFVIKEINRDEYGVLPWFIHRAHELGAKIHGLGMTQREAIRKYHFDSVDSSTWASGNRFGHLFRFCGGTIKQEKGPDGCRMIRHMEVRERNFVEWCKFQKFARTHL